MSFTLSNDSTNRGWRAWLLTDTPHSRMQARLGRAYLGFALAHRGLYLLMFSGELDKAKSPELEEASRTAFAQLEAGISARGVKNLSGSATAAWAFVHGLAHLIIDRQIDEDPKQIAGIFASAPDVFTPPPARRKKQA